jgi:hypothetical protein
MDIKQIEILARFYFADEKLPFVDKTVTSRQEAVELAHEGVWVKDSFYLVRKMTILPPAKKPKCSPPEMIEAALNGDPVLA